MSATITLLTGDTIKWTNNDNYGYLTIHDSGALQLWDKHSDLLAVYAPVAWLHVTIGD